MAIITTSNIHNTLEEIITACTKRESKIKISLTENQIISLCSRVSKALVKEPQIIPLRGKFIIVGDLHGNIDSLLRIFNHFNYPPQSSYIFLGDYIDRGKFSSELIIFLYSLKILYPMNIFLLRGNHECDSMASVNGFKTECVKKFSKSVYEAIIKSFDYLSIAIELNFRIFCVHGGISPLFKTIDEVNNDKNLKKPLKEPFPDMINDLLWSDPSNSISRYSESPRTIGKLYGFDAAKEFLEEKCDHLILLVRSHEMMPYGYDYPFDDKGEVLTIFSSIDYCGNANSGSVAVVDENSLQIEELEHLSQEKKKNIRYIYPEFILSSSNTLKIKQINTHNLTKDIQMESLSDEFTSDHATTNLAG
ncbi:hypothetical protein M9Y10_011616 [Tritrichomonas musculus]|uniref:Serine/threonine-protein phosphatase n=1 Tax=Tritrichomonas musculus TaxID=1915356 RepID=A0ABR2IL75_9EUKA